MSLRAQLQAIHNQHGKLTPELVVEEARPKGHPLHDRVFDRPKGEAAEAWYRHRAHELIQSIKITRKEDDAPSKEVRAFHAVPSPGPEPFVYEPAERVAADPFMRQVVLNQMEREWKALMARYEGFQEFVAMVNSDIGRAVAA